MSLPDIQVNVVVNLKGDEKIKELNSLLDSLIAKQRTLSRTSRQAATGLKVMERQVVANTRSARKFKDAQTALNTSLGSGNRSMRAYGNAVKGQYKVLEGVAKKVLTVRKAFNTSISTMQRMMRAYNDSRKPINGFMNRLSYMERQMDALFRASYRLSMTGDMLKQWAMSLLRAMFGLTQAWGEFEFMLNRAAGALQLFKDDSVGAAALYDELMESIMGAAKELALFPAEEVAKATYFWGSTTGQVITSLRDIERLMGAVNPLMKIAAMTQVDYETAIKGTYSILVQYGKSIADTEDVTSKLFLMTQKTALEFPDLINSFKMVGPLAASMGVTFEDVASLLGKLGDAGIRGTMSGRALRQTFIKLVRPTQKAREALDGLYEEKYGKTFSEMVFPNGTFTGMTTYIHDLAYALKDMTMEQKAAILATITTANELPVVTALIDDEIKKINDLGGGWDEAKTALGGYGSAVEIFEKSWSILANSWKGLTSQIERGIEIIQLRLGKVIAEALTPAIEKAREMLKQIEDWIKNNPKIVEFVAKMAGAVAVFMGIAGAVLSATGALAGLYAGFKAFAFAIAPATAKLVAIGVAFVAFIDAVKRNWGYIVRTVMPSIRRLQRAFDLNEGAISNLREAVQDLFKQLRPVFDWVVRRVADIIKVIIDLVSSIVEFSRANKWVLDFARSMALAFAISRVLSITKLAGALASLFAIIKSGAIITMLGVARIKALGFALSALMKVGPLVIASVLLMIAEGIAKVADSAGVHIPIISDLFGEIGDSAEAAADKVRDFYASLDSGRKSAALRTAILQDSGTLGALNTARQNIQPRTSTSTVTGKEETVYPSQVALDAYNKALDDATAAEGRIVSQIQSVADYWGTSVDSVTDTVLNFRNKYGATIDESVRLTEEYFEATEGGTKVVPEAFKKMWQDSRNIMLKYGITAEDLSRMFINPEEMARLTAEAGANTSIAKAQEFVNLGKYKEALDILNPLKDDIQHFSLQTEQAFNGAMSGIPAGIRSTVEEAMEIAEAAPSDIFQAFLSGLTTLGSMKAQWKEIRKNKDLNKPPHEIVKEIIRQYTNPNSPLNKALSSKNPAFRFWGETKAGELQTLLLTTLTNWTGPIKGGNGKNRGRGKDNMGDILRSWLDPSGKNYGKDIDPLVAALMGDVYTSIFGTMNNTPVPPAPVPEGSATGVPIYDASLQSIRDAAPLYKLELGKVIEEDINKPLSDFFGPAVTVQGAKIEVKAQATKKVDFNLRITGGTQPNTNAGATRAAITQSDFYDTLYGAATNGVLP